MFTSLLSAAALIALGIPNAQAGDVHSEIYNGEETQTGSPIAQSAAFIVTHFPRYSTSCSGTVIAKDLILTASHCLGEYQNGKLTVYFGLKHSPTGGPGGIAVIEHREPENAMLPGQAHGWRDLSILKLAKPVPADYVPAKLAAPDLELSAGTEVTLAGYGTNAPEPKHQEGAGTLRQVKQKVLDPHYDSEAILLSIQDKGACYGDSGGPAYLEVEGVLELIGVASRLTDNDLISPPGKPAVYACKTDMVYTDVRAQHDWIVKTMAELESKTD